MNEQQVTSPTFAEAYCDLDNVFLELQAMPLEHVSQIFERARGGDTDVSEELHGLFVRLVKLGIEYRDFEDNRREMFSDAQTRQS